MGVQCMRRALVLLFIFNIILFVQNWKSNQHFNAIEAILESNTTITNQLWHKQFGTYTDKPACPVPFPLKEEKK